MGVMGKTYTLDGFCMGVARIGIPKVQPFTSKPHRNHLSALK